MDDGRNFRFQIYVAEGALNSLQAVANLRAICRAYLPDRHEIEVVDVFTQPLRALADRIVMTPTLVVLSPPPLRRIVGSLSDTEVVLRGLGLELQVQVQVQVQ